MTEADDKTVAQPPAYEDSDVIVIKKSWLITGVVAIAAFLVGGVVGYFAFSYAFNQGSNGSLAAIQAAIAQQGGTGGGAQPPEPPARIDNVSVDDDPSVGPKDAPVKIVEFSDFQCPYCERFEQQTFQPLLDKYGDKIQFVYRDFPLSSIHPDAEKAAEAAECADEQGKFWDLHNAMFQNQTVTGVGVDAISTMAEEIKGLDVDKFNECISSGKMADEVSKDLQDGTAYGVSGTPTFFINGVRLVGAQPLAAFTTVIDQELTAAK